MTHDITMTQEITETTETRLSKTFENTRIYNERESGSESDLRLIAVAGAHPIQGELLLRRCHRRRPSARQETPNEEFTASPPSEAGA